MRIVEGKGPPQGFKIIELQALGLGHFGGMMLADMGAEVIRVERIGAAQATHERCTDAQSTFDRGGLKSREGVEAVLRLVEKADGLIEGFRAGRYRAFRSWAARLSGQKSALSFMDRMTGWGQDGPMAQLQGMTLITSHWRRPARYRPQRRATGAAVESGR